MQVIKFLSLHKSFFMNASSQKIVIIDYGMGNLRSVQQKFTRLQIPAEISCNIDVIAAADKLILPGVGHFANGMKNLKNMGLLEVLNQKVLQQKIPILGICLGMQLFTEFSEEGNVEGLGWIKGKTIKFSFPEGTKTLKVPHMGWNNIYMTKSSKLMENIADDAMFYFVHSYHVQCADASDCLTMTNYGIDFCSAVERDNIYGTQFHPEKSHDSGFQIIKNFIQL